MEEKKTEPTSPDLNKRREILGLYVNEELPEKIEDPIIRDLCMDRKKHKQRIAGMSDELKSYMQKLQKMAGKMQADISDANGAIKYVDSKIVQRHIELTDVGTNP